MVKAPAENPLLFLTPILALAVLRVSREKKGDQPKQSASLNAQVGVLGTVFLCAFAGGAFICLRAGSDINYFFEAGMVASVSMLPSAIVLFNWNKLATAWFFSLASAILCCVCLIQLAAFMAPGVQVGIPARLAFLRTSTFGRLRLITQQQEDERRMSASLIASAPKPILIVDELLSALAFHERFLSRFCHGSRCLWRTRVARSREGRQNRHADQVATLPHGSCLGANAYFGCHPKWL